MSNLPPGIAVLKRKRGEERKNINIAISKRVYLYAKERYSIPPTVEGALKYALEQDGIDCSRPHNTEVWSPPDPLDPNGKPITWGEARRQGLVNEKDELVASALGEQGAQL